MAIKGLGKDYCIVHPTDDANWVEEILNKGLGVTHKTITLKRPLTVFPNKNWFLDRCDVITYTPQDIPWVQSPSTEDKQWAFERMTHIFVQRLDAHDEIIESWWINK